MLLTLLNAALLSASSSSKFKVDWDSLFERLTDWSIEIGKSILGAILIYIIGRFIIKQIKMLENHTHMASMHINIYMRICNIYIIENNLPAGRVFHTV